MLLDCPITDILEWKPDPNEKDPDNHPLAPLRKERLDFNSQRKIRKLTVEQLKKLKEFVDGL